MVDGRPDSLKPDAVLEGGDLDCGSGLLLLIRAGIDPLERGQILEIRSTEPSVEVDLPAWCRLTRNELLSTTREGGSADPVRSFFVCKGTLAERGATRSPLSSAHTGALSPGAARVAPSAGLAVRDPLPSAVPVPPIPPRAVMGIGSWPRPRWLLQAIHDHMAGRLPEEQFQATADDAVRLAVAAQVRAGVSVVTDGEQRRDAYASFVAGRLDNCQLIPLTDLLPLVDDPEKFRAEMASLDVPADQVRHPAVFGRLARSRPIAGHELSFARAVTDRPVKVALPGPYLLSRTMWMECISDRAYASREELAEDVVRVLREELFALLAAGAALVQLDEPVLTEVVYTAPTAGRSFMCGALSDKRDAAHELGFARELLEQVVAGAPRERLALHVCRGNWTPDESAALTGDYRPLVQTLAAINVGTYFLELCTPRAGDIEVLRALPDDRRIGVGVVNQKHATIEPVAEIVERIRRAANVLGRDRMLLTPDCGFATFADNPVAAADVAEAKLQAIVEAVQRFER